MKRTRDTRNEGTPNKSAKQKRIDNHSIAPIDCFAEEFEVTASVLADSPLDEARHIVGQVFMLWTMSNNTRKLQLKMSSDSLDVVFEGPNLEKLDFLSRDKLKVSLKGGRKDAKKAGSPHTLPFKLVFPNGALVQFLASEKRQDEKIVDLFQDAEENIRRGEEDWFCSSQTSDLPFHDQALHSQPNDSTTAPREPGEVHHRVFDPDAASHDVFHNAALAREIEDHAPALNYGYRIGERHAQILCPPLNVTAGVDPTRSSSSYAPVSSPAAVSSVVPPQNKGKRIKKRDTRHARSSLGGGTSDNVSRTNTPESNTEKPLGKKARKRLAAKTKAEAAKAKRQPPSPPAPYRDPALDFVAGFQSERGGIYTPLGDIVAGQSYSLVGVVVDVSSIKRTKAGDISKSYILVDPSLYGHQSLTVNLFVSQPDELLLPSASSGQILLLRNIKFKEFYGKPQGTGYKDTFQWCGYNPTDGRHFYTPTTQLKHTFFIPSAAEMGYFVKLADWSRAINEADEIMRVSTNDPSSSSGVYIIPPGRTRLKKLQIISELDPGTFVDCVVELLKIWKGDLFSDIYVTDYTENKHLQHNLDVDGSVFGRRTLKVSLWDGANTMVDDLELHSLYLLKNMRLKKLEGSRIFLEGHLGFGDRMIYKLGIGSDQENVQELLSRKREYERNPWYSRFESLEGTTDVPEPMQQGHVVPDVLPRENPESVGIMACSHMEQKRSTIKEVQRNHLCPNKFRVCARIIEYFPRRIENFVTVECSICGEILDDRHHNCPNCGDLTGKSTSIRYQFALRIVDESGSELNINVSDNEAAELLTGIDPRDAREDATDLKSRLKPLLGHLHALHDEFDEENKAEDGPWVDMCLNSWVPEAAEGDETMRSYKLFGCKLRP